MKHPCDYCNTRTRLIIWGVLVCVAIFGAALVAEYGWP